MVLPFLFIRSTKGFNVASKLTFISHISFSFAIAYNFFRALNKRGLSMFSYGDTNCPSKPPPAGSTAPYVPCFWWLPNFEIVGWKTAVSSFPVVWMAFSFQFNFFPVATLL
jgi:hypothetical protein